jgi:hypothetical protein
MRRDVASSRPLIGIPTDRKLGRAINLTGNAQTAKVALKREDTFGDRLGFQTDPLPKSGWGGPIPLR